MYTVTKSNNVQRRTNGETVEQPERKLGYSRFGEFPIIAVLVSIAGGMLSLIVLFSLVPVIGSSVDNSMPTIENDSPWASEDMPTGSGLWSTVGPLLVLCALIAVIMVVLKLLGVF